MLCDCVCRAPRGSRTCDGRMNLLQRELCRIRESRLVRIPAGWLRGRGQVSFCNQPTSCFLPDCGSSTVRHLCGGLRLYEYCRAVYLPWNGCRVYPLRRGKSQGIYGVLGKHTACNGGSWHPADGWAGVPGPASSKPCECCDCAVGGGSKLSLCADHDRGRTSLSRPSSNCEPLLFSICFSVCCGRWRLQQCC